MFKCNEAGCEAAANHVILIPPVEAYPVNTDWREVSIAQRGDIYAFCDFHIDGHEHHEAFHEVDGQQWFGTAFSTLHLIRIASEYHNRTT